MNNVNQAFFSQVNSLHIINEVTHESPTRFPNV